MPNKSFIKDLNVKYSIVFRDIKYPRLELKTGNLIIIVPRGYKNPEKLIEEHEEWIQKKIKVINESKERSKGKKLNYERSEEDLRKMIHENVDRYSIKLNVEPNRIILRNMKSKWGSCSSKKNLNFNKLLKFLPWELIEYVIFHEMTHMVENKHNKNFWRIISTRFNDYKQKENDLMDYWFLIQSELMLD
ncbi:MAG: M48 family metallopeptidase [Candidatus Atribacteria bacterium]|jgi:predicted metal-dependent hydrolase|nr:M48 family metallopeptidase [Candidatus Atribacteria bacterium]